jgi:hypothetical protein
MTAKRVIGFLLGGAVLIGAAALAVRYWRRRQMVGAGANPDIPRQSPQVTRPPPKPIVAAELRYRPPPKPAPSGYGRRFN